MSTSLVEIFRKGGSNRPLITQAAEQTAQIAPALLDLLTKPDGARLDVVGGALDYLPLVDWSPLITAAIQQFEQDNEHEVAWRILASGLYQAPQAFHPHLERIFSMKSFLEMFGPVAWRGADRQSIHFLLQMSTTSDPAQRCEVSEILQQTHAPQIIADALAAEKELGAPCFWRYANNPFAYHEYFAVMNGQVQLLYLPDTYHLHFPPGYVQENQQSTPFHPTWVNMQPEGQAVSFGGALAEACPNCNRPLQHLLTLESIPAGINGLPRLTLAVCTNGNCLGLGLDTTNFYQHDSTGQPHGIPTNSIPLGGEIPYLTATAALLGKTDSRWQWQDPNSRQANLNHLGGLPSWVQEPGHPACPECGNSMTFLLQLDSGLQNEQGGYLRWCSGLLYGFWCDACRVSAFFRQCC